MFYQNQLQPYMGQTCIADTQNEQPLRPHEEEAGSVHLSWGAGAVFQHL